MWPRSNSWVAQSEKQRKTCCAGLEKYLKTLNATLCVALQHSTNNTAHCSECVSSRGRSSPVIGPLKMSFLTLKRKIDNENCQFKPA